MVALPQERFLCADDALLSGVAQAARAMGALPRKMDDVRRIADLNGNPTAALHKCIPSAW